MMIEDCTFSESLVATYTSYKNGGRDKEKLTPEQLATAYILESEFVLTAVCYFIAHVEEMENGESFDCVSSPARVIDNLDFEDFSSLAMTFVQSKLQETNAIVDELEELLNGAK